MAPVYPVKIPRDLVLLGAILLGAAVLRFLWLDQYPVGWHSDEALMGVMAAEVYHGTNRPVFFLGFHGNEALYPYLGALMIWLMGGDQGVMPFRVLSALAGSVTVVLTYLLGKELFDRRVGLIAAALLGTNFWQVMSSRTAYRSILEPITQAIAVYCLWRGARTKSPWWWIASGAAVGATLYTYLGGRAFPAVLLGFGLWALIFVGFPSRRVVTSTLLLAVAAGIVLLPLTLFFAQHPGAFWTRLEMVSVTNAATTGGRPIEALIGGVQKFLGIFTFAGEPMWRYNLPFRPVFVWFVAPFFYVGLLTTFARFVRRDASSALLLAWLTVMSLPSVLSVDQGGYWLRAMGLVPAIYLLPGLGFVALLDWIGPRVRLRFPRWGVLAGGCVAAVVVLDGVVTFDDFFFRWGPSFGAAYETDLHIREQASRLERTARPDVEETFAGAEYFGQPAFAQLAPSVYSGLRWFDGTLAFVYAPESRKPSRYVFSLTTLPEEVDRYLPRDALVSVGSFPIGIDGNPPPPTYVDYRVTPEQVRSLVGDWLSASAMRRIEATFGDQIEALGSRYETVANAGRKQRLEVAWRVLAPSPGWNHAMFAHLVDDAGKQWAQRDANGFPPPSWRPGDIVLSRLDLPIPADIPSGRYWIVTGIYDRDSLNRLQGTVGGERISEVRLGALRVVGSAPTLASSGPNRRAIGAQFADGIRLDRAGWATAGGKLDVTLGWNADSTPSMDYTVFVQLLDPSGRLASQSDSEPLGGRMPTGLWLPGEAVPDEHELDISALAPGRYHLIVGMYHLPDGRRLPLTGGEDFVALGDIAIGN